MGQKHVTPRVLMGERRTPGETWRVYQLLKLARAEFGRLEWADRLVVVASALGEIAEFTNKTPDYFKHWVRAIEAEKETAKVNDARDHDKWPDPICLPVWKRPVPKVEVRPEVIRWLLTDLTALSSVHAAGVQIRAAHIPGLLDLEYAIVGRQLWCSHCVLGCALLRKARCRTIVLLGCLLNGLELQYLGNKPVFDAEGVRIDGDLIFRYGFKAEGEVKILGAFIAGELICEDGSFINHGNISLSADGSQIGGGAYFCNGFRSNGEVRLIGARIAGDLLCEDGSFINPRGKALSADRAEIEGGVFIGTGFRGKGEVRFPTTRIAARMDCMDGSFVNPSGVALNVNGARVEGALFLRETRKARGEIDLTNCYAGYLDDNPKLTRQDARLAWPERIRLTGFLYNGIFPGAPLDAGDRLDWLANHDMTIEGSRPDAPPDPQPYRQLAEVLKRQGRDADARAVLYGYEVKRADEERRLRFKACWYRPAWLRFLGAQVYRLLVGFGFYRWRALAWLAVLLITGSLVFGYQSGRRMQPSQMLALREFESAHEQNTSKTKTPPLTPRYPKFNALVYSADALIPLVSFHQEEYWTPRGDPEIHSIKSWWSSHGIWSGRWWTKAYLVFHISMGWVIATLFAASFTRLMRHD